ncbi:hypothetical protein ACOI22_14315 [Glaciecola sp. 2405UD65-10]|uniref:hypothetical protein n=1 Tax=Glaciecola sp. 2405UD65-10 TaxID=3397244 RepID=UPI003B598942
MSNKWESQKTLFEQREEQHSANLNKASNSGSFIGFLILLVIGVIFIVGIIEWVHSYSLNFFSNIKFTQSNALYFAYAGDVLFFIVVIVGVGLLVSLSLWLIDYLKSDAGHQFIGKLVVISVFAAINYLALQSVFPNLNDYLKYAIITIVTLPLFVSFKWIVVALPFPVFVLIDMWFKWGLLSNNLL